MFKGVEIIVWKCQTEKLQWWDDTFIFVLEIL